MTNLTGRYSINGGTKKMGTFICDKTFTSSGRITLGLRRAPLNGAIAVFEGCKSRHGLIPDKIIDLLVEDQHF